MAEIKPLTLTGSFEKIHQVFVFRFHLEVKDTNLDDLFWGLWEVEDEIEDQIRSLWKTRLKIHQ